MFYFILLNKLSYPDSDFDIYQCLSTNSMYKFRCINDDYPVKFQTYVNEKVILLVVQYVRVCLIGPCINHEDPLILPIIC
jgi:hypothetical protein